MICTVSFGRCCVSARKGNKISRTLCNLARYIKYITLRAQVTLYRVHEGHDKLPEQRPVRQVSFTYPEGKLWSAQPLHLRPPPSVTTSLLFPLQVEPFLFNQLSCFVRCHMPHTQVSVAEAPLLLLSWQRGPTCAGDHTAPSARLRGEQAQQT